MGFLRQCMWVGAILVSFALGGRAFAIGRIVYSGPDPSCHYTQPEPEAVTLAHNMVLWTANDGPDPKIAVINETCNTLGLLAAAGFTQVTLIDSGDVSTTNLSMFQVIYVPPFFSTPADPGFAPAIAAFVNGGGGLVVEGGSDLAAFPFGTQVGPSLVGGDLVEIVAPSHPVMTGLTDAGLSNWGSTFHTTFAAPGAAGFEILLIGEPGEDLVTGAQQINGVPVLIALGTSPRSAPALDRAGLATLAALLLGTGAYALRRRTAPPRA